MTGLWLVSYLILWALVVAACLLLVGGLRQVGLLQRQLGQHAAAADATTLEQDGPAISSRLPDLVAETANGFGPVALAPPYDRDGTLLVFMTALCESCQHIVESLNALAEEGAHGMRLLVIMQADDHACRAFLRVFPLRVPLICDDDRTITDTFTIHLASFALLYDEHGTLVRKGVVESRENLSALLRDAPATVTAQAHMVSQVV